MRTRPNMTEILKKKVEAIKSGARNVKNTINSSYYYNSSLEDFYSYAHQAGIAQNFGNLATKQSIVFKNDNPVTRFLASKTEIGAISTNILNYVHTIDSLHFSDAINASAEENTLFSEYVEEMVE